MADIRKTLPPSVGKTNVINELLEAVQPEAEALEREMRAACQRLSVEHCDARGAALWENETGILNREGLPLEMRKTLIRLALEGRETCTPQRLKTYLERMLEGEAEIREDFAGYALALRARTDQIRVPSMSTAIQALRERIPAHLAFTLAVEASMNGLEGSCRLMHQAIRMRIAAKEENV